MIRFSSSILPCLSRSFIGSFQFIRFYRSRPKQVIDDQVLPELSKQEQLRLEDGLRELRNPQNRMPHPYRYDIKHANPMNEQTILNEKPKKEENPKKEEKKESGILDNVQIDKENLSETDYRFLQSVKESAPRIKDTKKMTVNNLLQEMDLTKDDLSFMVKEMNRQKNPSSDPFSRLENLIQQDNSIMILMDKWINEVEQKLGKDLVNFTSLTQDDIKKIPPPPEKLQEVVKYLFSSDK